MTGLHTLVDGLTISPTSPIDSPPPVSSSRLHISSTSDNVGHSSIFNNPSGSTTAATSPSSTPRLHDFGGSRGVNYSQGGASSLGTLQKMRRRNSDPIVKEVDDPSTHANIGNQDKYSTYSGFPRLFSAPSVNPSAPRQRNPSYRGSDNSKLEDFLYTRGFLEGACSDVTIFAFGTRYNLHRLILDRSPFFSSCLNGGPWLESKSSEITITPEESDSNITQHAFELSLARLYGHQDHAEEDQHAMALLAAASYLDLQDLVESCVLSLLRSLKTSNIAQVVKFVTASYYGPVTDRLLESAKAMLYRDGWEMEMSDWDGISGEIAADIIGYDGFYVPDEWLRYCFVKEMIDWRICHSGDRENKGLSICGSFLGADTATDDGSTHEGDEADLKPLRDLLEHGIYYMHMSFEELQKIAEDRDILGRKAVPEYVVREALWQQTLLRQKVLNALQNSPELGITERESPAETSNDRTDSNRGPKHPESYGKFSEAHTPPMLTPSSSARNHTNISEPSLSSFEVNKRKYYIPMEDTTTVIGDHQELNPVAVIPNNPRAPRTAGADSSAATTSGSHVDKDQQLPPREELRYSTFPPFRFSAEFRAVKQLKEKKRVYSKTVFYAGSHWNIYIQKVRSSKNVQLGVYLHRAKDRESALNIAATGYAHIPAAAANADGTIISGDEGSVSRSGFDGVDDTTLLGADSAGRGTPPNRGSGSNGSPAPQQSSNVVPAISYYTDSRPTVQTYFKIFSPSKKGKVLSMFSSGPDSFNFSQSWGWKSSSLILDESLIAEGDSDARLRFMVVLGNV